MVNGQPRQLHLGYMYWVNGTHWGGWRRPDAPQDGAFDVEYVLRAARTVEQAKFDFFFLGDTLPGDVVQEQWRTTSNTGRLEPFTLLSQIALLTKDIGLAVTAHPTFYDPYILARLTSSLDHLSHGRVSWNVVLGNSDIAARNFSLPDLGGDARYERADEFIEVVKRLWDSVEDDAYIQDKESGHYVDDAKIHRIGWTGRHFRVEGTLPLRRPPQGHPPILYAGASESSRNLTAKHGDLNFTAPRSIADSIAFNEDVRARAAALGRDPEQIFFLPGITPIVGDTRESATAIYDELNSYLPLDEDVVWGGRTAEQWAELAAAPGGLGPLGLSYGIRNLGALSAKVGVELTGLSLADELSRAVADGFNGYGRHLLDLVAERTRRVVDGPSPVRVQDLLYAGINDGFPLIVGTATDVADELEAWFTSGAADGFNIQSPSLWEQLDRFADRVVPILQRRGLFRREYETHTFRDHFGLPRPAGYYDDENVEPASRVTPLDGAREPARSSDTPAGAHLPTP